MGNSDETMSKPVIAVIGGSGKQGGGVVDALLASGQFTIRVVSRNPLGDTARALTKRGVEIIKADLLDAASLRLPFNGAYGAFVVTNFWDPNQMQRETEIGAAAVKVARSAGVEHLIWSTLPDCERISGGRFKVAHFTQKSRVNAVVEAAGFRRYTFVHAPQFFQNFLTMDTPKPLPNGGRGWAVPMDPAARVMHCGDPTEVGRAVAAAFAADDRLPNGSHLAVCGGLYSWNDLVATLNAQGHKLQVIRVAPPEAYDNFYPGAKEMREMYQYFEEYTYFGPEHAKRTAAANALVPGGFTAFADWAKVHMKPPQGDPNTSLVTPFRVEVPQAALDDLRHRIGMTRWPEPETASDWSQGVPLDKMKALLQYWAQGYDWRAAEARLNAFPQFRTEIDGLGIHFLHVRSKHENALPIIMTHGWPGSVFEFLKVIEPLVDPTAHGGKATDAFHVVVPSLPGYGFSDKPSQPGWGLPRIAKAWAELMKRLGYTRWVAQGGDWGAGVSTWLAKQHAEGLVGIHLNFPIFFPPPIEGEPNAEEQASIAQLTAFGTRNSGYAKLMGTRPQTAGYALQDSPVGLAAWIYEKIAEWTQSNWQPETVLTRDEILDDITLYWLTGTATSSSRLYAESFFTDNTTQKLDIPVAVSVFPGELFRPLKLWGERVYSNLIYWNEVARGGHFAALEQPSLFVSELRAGLASLR